jgi:large subunit ribosomal protein L19
MKARMLTRETILDMGTTEKKLPKFNIGDTIVVGQIIKEGDKERIQDFQGDVIGMHQNGIASTFTVRRISANGVGVERIFPFHSPLIAEIRVAKSGKTRRAKLYYVRERLGKAARIKENVMTKADAAKADAAAKAAE